MSYETASHAVTNGTTDAKPTDNDGLLAGVNVADVRLLEALALLLDEEIHKTFADAVRAHREAHIPAFRKQHGGTTPATPTTRAPRTPKADKAAQ